MTMIGSTEKQDGTELSLEEQTLPGGCKWSDANWILLGKGPMTHVWDNFHKDGFLLSTSMERCVDFPTGSTLCCLPSDFATQRTLEFPTDPTKCTLSFPWMSRKLKSEQISLLSRGKSYPPSTLPAPSSCKPASNLTVFNWSNYECLGRLRQEM